MVRKHTGRVEIETVTGGRVVFKDVPGSSDQVVIEITEPPNTEMRKVFFNRPDMNPLAKALGRRVTWRLR